MGQDCFKIESYDNNSVMLRLEANLLLIIISLMFLSYNAVSSFSWPKAGHSTFRRQTVANPDNEHFFGAFQVTTSLDGH